MITIKAELKDRLAQAMNENRIKAVDVCERTGIPKSAMSYYLAGKAEPKSDRLYILAKTLNVSEAWLLGYDVDMARDKTQKELDDVGDIVERINKDKDFRQLLILINHLKPEQLELINNLVSALPQS